MLLKKLKWDFGKKFRFLLADISCESARNNEVTSKIRK